MKKLIILLLLVIPMYARSQVSEAVFKIKNTTDSVYVIVYNNNTYKEPIVVNNSKFYIRFHHSRDYMLVFKHNNSSKMLFIPSGSLTKENVLFTVDFSCDYDMRVRDNYIENIINVTKVQECN